MAASAITPGSSVVGACRLPLYRSVGASPTDDSEAPLHGGASLCASFRLGAQQQRQGNQNDSRKAKLHDLEHELGQFNRH
jgi:hypothetical protein